MAPSLNLLSRTGFNWPLCKVHCVLMACDCFSNACCKLAKIDEFFTTCLQVVTSQEKITICNKYG